MDQYETFFPQDDYDYLDCIDPTIRSVVYNPVHPSPEDNFEDYMNHLCAYMLFKTSSQA